MNKSKLAMKSTVLLIGFMLLAGILPGQVPKPAKPAYVVNYEQKGKNANDSWFVLSIGGNAHSEDHKDG